MSNNPFRAHVCNDSPHRLPGATSRHIPRGIDHRANCHVHHSLLRAKPPELGVRGKTAPEPAHVGANPIETLAHNERCEGTDRSHADLVPTACRERESVTVESLAAICAQRYVSGRVVGVDVERIRAMKPPRSRKSNVGGVEADDGHTVRGCAWDHNTSDLRDLKYGESSATLDN